MSLIEIQKKYKLIDYRNDYLIFEKSEISNNKNEISILKVDISPTFLGKFVKFIFKIPKIEITLKLNNEE